jgi:hypothetical protein
MRTERLSVGDCFFFLELCGKRSALVNDMLRFWADPEAHAREEFKSTCVGCTYPKDECPVPYWFNPKKGRLNQPLTLLCQQDLLDVTMLPSPFFCEVRVNTRVSSVVNTLVLWQQIWQQMKTYLAYHGANSANSNVKMHTLSKFGGSLKKSLLAIVSQFKAVVYDNAPTWCMKGVSSVVDRWTCANFLRLESRQFSALSWAPSTDFCIHSVCVVNRNSLRITTITI